MSVHGIHILTALLGALYSQMMILLYMHFIPTSSTITLMAMHTTSLVKDLYNALDSTDQGSNVILNFGHTDSIQPFIAAMGLYK